MMTKDVNGIKNFEGKENYNEIVFFLVKKEIEINIGSLPGALILYTIWKRACKN